MMHYTILTIVTEDMNFSQSKVAAQTFVNERLIPYKGNIVISDFKTSERSAVHNVDVEICNMSRTGMIYNKIRRKIYEWFGTPMVYLTSSTHKTLW